MEYEKLSDERLGEPSSAIQARVEAARVRQRQRFEGKPLFSNADMGPAEVRDYCPVDGAGKNLLRAGDTSTCSAGTSVQQLHMSARALPRAKASLLPQEFLRNSPHPETGPDHRRPGRMRCT